MLRSLSAILFATVLLVASLSVEAAENLVFVTWDGFRFQEVFGGAEERLISKEAGGIPNVPDIRHRFWRETPEARRETLLPFFWGTLVKNGQLFGDPARQAVARVTNGKKFSYPGYNEMFAGFADDRVRSNDKIPNPNITVLEYLNRQPRLSGRVAAFATWDVIPFILNRERSGLPVQAGWTPLDDSSLTDTQQQVNQMVRELPQLWPNNVYDIVTVLSAKEYVKKHKPRVLYVGLGETDEWAHARRYDLYLESAHRSDRYLAELWEMLQSMPEYKDKTALVLTTDHGRGNTPKDWTNHGTDTPEAEYIWIAAMGQGIPPLGVRENVSTTQSQVAATLAQLVGEDFARVSSQTAPPLPLASDPQKGTRNQAAEGGAKCDGGICGEQEKKAPGSGEPGYLWSTAYAIPKETTSEGSGYFSIIEGKNGRLYVGTAKYRHNAYLVEFDLKSKQIKIVVDAHKEIGTTATGFAAQAKIHTRNNTGPSGKIYFGTKQGYPKDDEKRTDYLGGYPMVFDPATGMTRVYPIPIPHQGIISVTPDESRNVAYISTCSDERPIESAHFMILELATGKYRDLLDTRHMYAFIVVDHQGRAYHPILGGEIVRYDPHGDKLEKLKQTIDGQPPTKESLLADPETHPINWDISSDGKTLWAVAMSGNALYSYDLSGDGDTLRGTNHGPLVAGAKNTDCRAMCVGPDGTIWAGVATTFEGREQRLHLVSYSPGTAAPRDHGPIAVKNPDFTTFKDGEGKDLPFHHGYHRPDKDGPLQPRYVIMGICASTAGPVYVTTLAPLTLHEIDVKKSPTRET